jgi:hypothetical protein
MQKVAHVSDVNETLKQPGTHAPAVPPVRREETGAAEMAPPKVDGIQVERAGSGWKGFVNYFLDGLSG